MKKQSSSVHMEMHSTGFASAGGSLPVPVPRMLAEYLGLQSIHFLPTSSW